MGLTDRVTHDPPRGQVRLSLGLFRGQAGKGLVQAGEVGVLDGRGRAVRPLAGRLVISGQVGEGLGASQPVQFILGRLHRQHRFLDGFREGVAGVR